MESGEHTIVGDTGGLPGLTTTTLPVQGVSLSYGHVVALAGDFYGVPSSPISEGATGVDRRTRFAAALDTLLKPTLLFGPSLGQAELKGVVALIDDEVTTLQPAVKNPTPTGASDLYAKMSGENFWATLYTEGQYATLSANNVDHFGLKAQMAYLAGHRLAILLATLAHNHQAPVPGGTAPTLADAYTANAFADHFLTDLFSAGHVRTPRGDLHNWATISIPKLGSLGDVLAWYAHDEDCKYGVNVTTSAGGFLMYGDKRIFDSVNSAGLAAAQAAVVASKQEVLTAFQTGVDPFAGVSLDAPPAQVPSKALHLAPDPAQARLPQSNPQHHMLFYVDLSSGGTGTLHEREDINDLTCSTYVACQTQLFTWTDLKAKYKL